MSSEPQTTEYGKIRGDFNSDRLADLCIEKVGVQTGPFGSQLHNEDYVKIGTPIITVEHLGDNRILHQNTPCVSKEDKERLSKYHLQTGDIVFSRVGSVDRRALVRESEDGWLFSGRCLRVRVDKKKMDPAFLSYFFGLENFRQYIRSIAVGATMPSINTKILSDVPVYYPELEEQREIANILYSLDEKIELNRQINQTLEQIAQAIFKSWFVDFEPVKAKIEAKQNGQDTERAAMIVISGKSEADLDQLPPDQLAQLTAIAAIFPDELVDSELGEIPNGWVWKPFGEFLKKTIGGDWGKEVSDAKHTEKVRILRGTDLPNVYAGNDYSVPVRYVESKKLMTRKLEDGDIVIEVSGGSPKQPTGRSLYITDNVLERLDGIVEPASFCRLFRPVSKKFGLLLAVHLSKIYVDGKTWSYQNQSTGISNFQTKVFLEKEYVVEPNQNLLTAFYDQVRTLFNKVYSGENRLLTMLRDTLLPKLLSGELPVNQADQ